MGEEFASGWKVTQARGNLTITSPQHHPPQAQSRTVSPLAVDIFIFCHSILLQISYSYCNKAGMHRPTWQPIYTYLLHPLPSISSPTSFLPPHLPGFPDPGFQKPLISTTPSSSLFNHTHTHSLSGSSSLLITTTPQHHSLILLFVTTPCLITTPPSNLRTSPTPPSGGGLAPRLYKPKGGHRE